MLDFIQIICQQMIIKKFFCKKNNLKLLNDFLLFFYK